MIIDFEKQYNRLEYFYFLQNHFLPDDFESVIEKIEILQSHKYIHEVTLLGLCDSLDLKIYEIEHRSENDPRVSLSKETFRIMANYGSRRSLVLFISSNSPNYRFSLVTLDLELEGKRVLKKYSNPRRYSFFLGPDSKKHTPQEYLIKKGRIKDLEDLKNRFSIEVVNKDFYEKIAVAFTELVGGKRKVGNRIREFEPLLRLPSIPPSNHQKYQEFAVRLIGRLVFVWFLKKKRSKDNNIPLVPDRLIAKEAISNNYYHDVLEKLFFQVLNTPISDRFDEFKTELWATIPFLNGGLFEPNREDYYEIDPVLNISKNINTLIVPDCWFEKFFDTFETYNFTIDENTSIDIELSIEPEMLGRIFENLLAEINPETGETARKNTGSYYTPRTIVEYMVDESLKQYLLTNTEITEEKIISLLDYSDESDALTDTEKGIVINVLDKIKIIDPACGSGAFPMGILQKMLLILQKVDPESIEWLIKQLERIPDVTLRREVEDKLVNENWNYIHKLGIIQNSIYGIDIQPIAVEISKLRFFLSLIVDEDIDDNKPNRGLKPLPNLEFKFVCADSLISIPENDKLSHPQNELFIDPFYEEFNKGVQDYFSAHYPQQKQRIRKNIEGLIDEKIDEKLNLIKSLSVLTSEHKKEKQRQELIKSQTRFVELWDSYKNLFSNEKVKFFDVKYFFPECKDGFDVVIANPPYIQFQAMNAEDVKLYENSDYKTFTRTGDIYTLFYEKSNQILKPNGISTFITSNKWMSANYGKKMRKYLIDNTNPIQLIDFSKIKLFESATVFVNILIFRNGVLSETMKACELEDDFNVHQGNLSAYLENKNIYLSGLTDETWKVINKSEKSIMNKIEEVGTPLKNWDIQFFRGITTGLNEAFHISASTKGRLINEDSNNKKIIKPLLRGKDIKRYNCQFADMFMINSHNGLREIGLEPIDVQKDYPVIFNHLSLFEKDLVVRQDQGRHWSNLRSCAFLMEFEKPKLVWLEISDRANYSYDDDGMYLTNSAYFMTGENLKYLLAVLNSKLADFYFFKITAQIAGGRKRYTKQYVGKVPIPKIPSVDQQSFENLVNQTLIAKKSNPQADTSELEAEIDRLVYELYELTEDEIAIIDESMRR